MMELTDDRGKWLFLPPLRFSCGGQVIAVQLTVVDVPAGVRIAALRRAVDAYCAVTDPAPTSVGYMPLRWALEDISASIGRWRDEA